ncbi:rifin, partial [Plasmodium reichenowi]
FNKQTQQRLHEYDERMKTTRQKCKDRCDKEIQKIILKDKLEKELMDKFATLQTDIQSDAIPTCICEKSLADKVEKNCLKCTQNLGGIVAPSSGVLAGIAEGALYAGKPGALKAAIDEAITAGATKIAEAAEAARILAGKKAVIDGLNALKIEELGLEPWESFIDPVNYTDVSGIVKIIYPKKTQMCGATRKLTKDICNRIGTNLGTTVENGPVRPPDKDAIGQTINGIVEGAKGPATEAAEVARKSATTGITEKETVLFEAGFNSSISSINAAIIAIVVIILVMVIIYKILRYRRKKKMKKKLQYIKLLEE